MKTFLMRLWGQPTKARDDEQRAAQERFEENLKKLTESEHDLERLGTQLNKVRVVAKTKQSSISTSTAAFTRTMVRNLTPPQMAAVKEAKAKDDQVAADPRDSNGDLVPVRS